MIKNIEETFYFVDEFCKFFEEWFRKSTISNNHKRRKKRRGVRKTWLHLSEIATIVILFHTSGYKCFKEYYSYIRMHHGNDFKNLVCYDRFVSLMKRAFPVLTLMLRALLGKATEVMFLDSTPYVVSKMSRASRHKVFKDMAAISKNSVGWYFGLKLHFLFNIHGEIVNLRVTKANVDDRIGARDLLQELIGKVFGDRGYIGKDFFKSMYESGVHIVTKIKAKMKNILMDIWDKFYLKKRSIVESIFSSIKSCNTFEHSRHRSVQNAFCHILSALISYQLRSDKPSFAPYMEEVMA